MFQQIRKDKLSDASWLVRRGKDCGFAVEFGSVEVTGDTNNVCGVGCLAGGLGKNEKHERQQM